MRCCCRYVLAVAWRGLVPTAAAAAAVGPWPECVATVCLCLCRGPMRHKFAICVSQFVQRFHYYVFTIVAHEQTHLYGQA